MEYEYEGKTEREAIEKAAAELGLERDQFDVEILETQKGSLFKKGYVRVRVTTASTPDATRSGDDGAEEEARQSRHSGGETAAREERSVADMLPKRQLADPSPQDDFEKALVEFVRTVIEKMGYEAQVTMQFREDKKVGLQINSKDSAILIGRKGKNLDALQLLSNVYAGKLGREDTRVILDTENYRIHREETLVRLAYNTADKVQRTRHSVLLEPMNPFERRLIHTTLGDIPNIETKSEGDGLYKRVRIIWKGVR